MDCRFGLGLPSCHVPHDKGLQGAGGVGLARGAGLGRCAPFGRMSVVTETGALDLGAIRH